MEKRFAVRELSHIILLESGQTCGRIHSHTNELFLDINLSQFNSRIFLHTRGHRLDAVTNPIL